MAEKYITKTDVTNHLQEIQKDKFVNSDYKKFAWGMEIFIDTLPAADVESVKHGCWIINSDGYYPQCSECMKEPQGKVMTDWCPNCGAKMDGGE